MKPLVRNKTGWVPPQSNDRHLEETIQTLKKLPLELKHNVKNNMTNTEGTALKALLEDKSIILKEADKGGAVVVMDSDYYAEKILDMLKDNSFYDDSEKQGDLKTRQMINDLIKKHGNCLMKEENDYLSNF
ncbi:hypothetical protein, partial [Solemya velum gill symbiont]|uniref:hypothetical protein n=1 Tax=Solemya velum gill symbiont TaxID=2340 RepID=UPI0015C3CFDC